MEFLYNPAVTLCGDSQPKKFTSVGNELELLLTTDGAVEAPGILFNFYVRKPGKYKQQANFYVRKPGKYKQQATSLLSLTF